MAQQASDYPITQKYGYDPTYPLNNGNHRGIDRIMPIGTPVIVNGVTIGLSGNTGYTTGQHLHIGKFAPNGIVLDPGRQGFNFNSARVVSVSTDATNGKYVRVLADGNYFVYLHLSQHTCHVGQVLTRPAAPAPQAPVTNQGTNEMINTREEATVIYRMLRPNGQPSEAEIQGAVGRRSFANFLRDAMPEISQRDLNIRNQQAQVAAQGAKITQLSDTITRLMQMEALEDVDEAEKTRLITKLQDKVATLTDDLEAMNKKLSAPILPVVPVPSPTVIAPPEPSTAPGTVIQPDEPQTTDSTATPQPTKPNWFIRLLTLAVTGKKV